MALAIFFWDLQTDIDGPSFADLLPKLYNVGQQRKSFNTKVFFLTLAQGVFDSSVVFFICFLPIG